MKLMTLAEIARILLTSPQALGQLIKTNPIDAPKPIEGKKYRFDDVVSFYKKHSRNGGKDIKELILEEELRLKRVKADEAEKKVIARSTVVDMIVDIDIVLEHILTDFAKEVAKDDKEKQELFLRSAKVRFKRWREFAKALS